MSQFLDEVRTTIRRRGLADSTEKTCFSWIRRYILLQEYQGRNEMTRAPRDDNEHFLNHLANDLNLSASSVNQALGAIKAPNPPNTMTCVPSNLTSRVFVARWIEKRGLRG